MKITAVEYRDCPGWPGYCVGSDGTVWSQRVRGGNNPQRDRFVDEWRGLRLFPNSDGYMHVNLVRDGECYIVPVARLVLEAFVGPCPPGMEACHFPDRNPANNSRENLRWDTRSGNQQDRKIHGTVNGLKGKANPHATLTEEIVLEIVSRRQAGEAYHRIAEATGTTTANVCRICLGQSWAHLTGIINPEKKYANRSRGAVEGK